MLRKKALPFFMTFVLICSLFLGTTAYAQDDTNLLESTTYEQSEQQDEQVAQDEPQVAQDELQDYHYGVESTDEESPSKQDDQGEQDVQTYQPISPRSIQLLPLATTISSNEIFAGQSVTVNASSSYIPTSVVSSLRVRATNGAVIDTANITVTQGSATRTYSFTTNSDGSITIKPNGLVFNAGLVVFNFSVKAPMFIRSFDIVMQGYNGAIPTGTQITQTVSVKQTIRVDAPNEITSFNPCEVSGEILYPSPVPENTMLVYVINGVGSNPSFEETGYMFDPSPEFTFDPVELNTPNPDGTYVIQVYLVDQITGEFLAYGDREVEFTREQPVPHIRIDTPTSLTGNGSIEVSGEILNLSPLPPNTMLVYVINGVGSNPSFNETGFIMNPDILFTFPSCNLLTSNPDGEYVIEVYLTDLSTDEVIASGERVVQFTN